MNATKYLKQDHDRMKGLMNRLGATKDPDRRQDLYDELEENLLAHAQAEEELFYPAVRKVKGLNTLVEEAIAEHRAVDAVCDEIAEVDVSDDAFEGRLKALRDTVLHHMEEEENEIFPKFEKGCSKEELEELGDQLEARKNQILERVPAEA